MGRPSCDLRYRFTRIGPNWLNTVSGWILRRAKPREKDHFFINKQSFIVVNNESHFSSSRRPCQKTLVLMELSLQKFYLWPKKEMEGMLIQLEKTQNWMGELNVLGNRNKIILMVYRNGLTRTRIKFNREMWCSLFWKQKTNGQA